MVKKIKEWLKKPFPLPWGKIANLKPGECRIRFKKTNLYLDYHIDKTTWYVTDPNEAFINNNYRDMKRLAKAQGFKNYIIEYYYKHTFWHELFNTLLHIAWGYANCYVLSMPWYLDLFDALFTGAGRAIGNQERTNQVFKESKYKSAIPPVKIYGMHASAEQIKELNRLYDKQKVIRLHNQKGVLN